jgi:hypothetical protein
MKTKALLGIVLRLYELSDRELTEKIILSFILPLFHWYLNDYSQKYEIKKN